MTMEVRVPQLPESVADATLVAWHKKVGDTVARDENLADLETDKVVLEVPAPVAGVIKSLDKAAGATVTSGELLAVIEDGRAGAAAAPKDRGLRREAREARKAEHAPPRRRAGRRRRKRRQPGKLSPAARRLVEENRLAAGADRGQRARRAHLQERRRAAPGCRAAGPGRRAGGRAR